MDEIIDLLKSIRISLIMVQIQLLLILVTSGKR